MKVLEQGPAGGDIGYLTAVTAAALLMAAVPFGVDKARTRGRKVLFWAFGLGLATLNYALATEQLGHLRELNAEPARELVHKATGLDSRIARATNSRKQLPQASRAVDQRMVDTADQAIALLNDARVRECGRVGEECRKLVAKLDTATQRRASLLQEKSATDRIAALDAELRQLEKDRADLGPVPGAVDPHAARLARQLGRWVDLGDNPIQAVADGLVAFVAIMVECIGLLGPNLLITSIGNTDQPVVQRQRWWRRRHQEPVVAAPAPALETAVLAETPVTPAKAKKPSKIKAAGVRELGDVREWLKSRTLPRAGSKIRPKDAYASYMEWCRQADSAPVSLTAFGTRIKGELNVQYEERNKRGFYVHIALAGAPKLAISNA